MRVLRFLMVMVVMLGLTGVAQAADISPDPLATPAGGFVQNLGDHAIAAMANPSLAPDARKQAYRQLLREAFDMKTIGHFVLGRAWDNATPDQQARFMKLFEELVLDTYGNRLNLYSGQSFKVKGTRPETDKDTVVISEVASPDGGTPTEIEWRVRDENGKLFIIDVVVAGISQSVTQRQEYGSILQRNGGDIEALLTLMKQRLQQPPQN